MARDCTEPRNPCRIYAQRRNNKKMASENEAMADFAEALWRNYIRPKMLNELQNQVSFYKAEVVTNPGNGTLTVKRPFDNNVTVSCSEDVTTTAAAGDQVIVFVLGKGNAANSIAISRNNLKDLRTIKTTEG